MEQRSDARKAARLPAVVYSDRFTKLSGEICDLGAGGLYICTETVIVPIGAAVRVSFAVTQPRAEVFELSGFVRHQSLHGFGIAFAGMDDAVRKRLADTLSALPNSRPRVAPSALRSALAPLG